MKNPRHSAVACGSIAVVCALLLAGCGLFSKRGAESAAAPASAPAASKAIAPGLAQTPDAVPRVEPLHPTANRWYSKNGRTYWPIADERQFRERGRASFFGPQHEGLTASGEPYQAAAMTAAHSRLPIPSYARISNLRSGKSAIVRVNDRGAWDRDEVIALSSAAAAKLGLAEGDRTEVEVERITPTEVAQLAAAAATTSFKAPPAPELPAATAVPTPPVVAAPPPAPLPEPVAAPPPAPVAAVPVVPAAPVAPVAAVTTAPVKAAATTTPASTAKAIPAAAPTGRFAVQVAVFAVASNAETIRARVTDQLAQAASDLPVDQRTARVERRGERSYVLVGDAADPTSAQSLADRVRGALKQEVVVYRR